MTAYDVSEQTLNYRKSKQTQKAKLTRADIMNYANNLLQPNFNKLKEALNSK